MWLAIGKTLFSIVLFYIFSVHFAWESLLTYLEKRTIFIEHTEEINEDDHNLPTFTIFALAVNTASMAGWKVEPRQQVNEELNGYGRYNISSYCDIDKDYDHVVDCVEKYTFSKDDIFSVMGNIIDLKPRNIRYVNKVRLRN